MDNYDRYENVVYLANSDKGKNIYTIVETDKKKGMRVSVINSQNQKLLKEIGLDDSSRISFMDTLDNIMGAAA